MSAIGNAKKELKRKFSSNPKMRKEVEEFSKNLPDDYIRKGDKIQACNNFETWEGKQDCMHYFAGMCSCPLEKKCPYGNKNKIWIKDGEKAKKHSECCRRVHMG